MGNLTDQEKLVGLLIAHFPEASHDDIFDYRCGCGAIFTVPEDWAIHVASLIKLEHPSLPQELVERLTMLRSDAKNYAGAAVIASSEQYYRGKADAYDNALEMVRRVFEG